MPRQAQLGKHEGQWFTKAGNPSGAYFGSVKTVPYRRARELFQNYLVKLTSERKQRAAGISTAELMDKFLAWLEASRNYRTFQERRLHLQRFIQFHQGPNLIADIPATVVTAEDLKNFLLHVREHNWLIKGWMKRKAPLDPFTVGKYQTSVMACFAWGAGRKNPSPCLPRDFHPFLGMERHKRPPEPLLESELLTSAEVKAIFDHADDDLGLVFERGRFRSRRPDECREDHPYRGFRDLLTVYYQTGARTSELADACVRHFGAGQIVLGKHKRAKTMKEAASRRITLTGEALTIVEKLCEGKNPDEPIFCDPKGRPWTRRTLGVRFKMVRKRAGVRNDLSIYSLRHLWISEALMAGIDAATVSRMAGTSISMTEKTYGHFRNDHFVDAQKRLAVARKASAPSFLN
jgi:integrase